MRQAKLGGALLLVLALWVSLLTGTGAAATASPHSGSAAASADRVTTARIRVQLRTPDGVPATVRLDGPSSRTIAGSGERAHVSRTVLVQGGDYRVAASPLTVDGRQYLPTVSRKEVRAGDGQTTTVRVTYRRGPAASDIEIVDLTTTSVSLDWSLKGKKDVQLRRTDGHVAAAGVTDGVAVATTGTTATDTGLQPATEYTYSLFTKVGQRWRGPVTRTLATMAEEGSDQASYILADNAYLLDADEIRSAAPTGAGVDFLPVDTVTPLVGSTVVLPVMPSLEGGYLGQVTAVADDGTVSLVPAALGQAFDYYKVNIDSFSSGTIPLKPVTSLRAVPNLVGRSGGRAAASLPACGDTTEGTELSFDPGIDLGGSFSGEVLSKDMPWVLPDMPVGAKLSTSLSATLSGALSGSVSREYSCGMQFKKVTVQVTEVPVPIQLVMEPTAEISVSGEMKLYNLGATATAGGWFKGQFGVGIDDQFEGGRIADVSPLEPHFSANGSVGTSVGGEITLGPGAATPAAGVVAGVRGRLNLLDASFSVAGVVNDSDVEGCVTANLGWSMDVDVLAEVWVADWTKEKVLDIPDLNFDGAYADPWYWPSDCQEPSGNDVYILKVDEEQASSTNVGAQLASLGYSVTYGTEMPANPANFGQIWVFGVYTGLPDAVRTGLEQYVDLGGSLMINSEHGCCDALNRSVDQLLDDVLVNDVDVVTACTDPCVEQAFPLSTTALGGIASTPNPDVTVTTSALGYYTGVPAANQLLTVNGYVAGTVWGPSDLVYDKGRVVTIGDSNWSNTYLVGQNAAFIQNVATYLAS